jgi:hypothetical protein
LEEELIRLKAAASHVADKVNAHGTTEEARLDAVNSRIDELALHGVREGAALGLAAMTLQMDEDFSVQPVGFPGDDPADDPDLHDLIDNYEGHANAIAEFTSPDHVLARLFHN